MLSDMQLLQIKNAMKRVLHVPGNYTGGILEMAIVADCCIPKEELTELTAQIAGALKRQDETFRNVRLNLIKWVSDQCIIKEVSSLTMLQMKRGFEDYDKWADSAADKSVDELLRQLKLFYARSKIVLVITDGDCRILDRQQVDTYLHPFLGRKMLFLNRGRSGSFSIDSFSIERFLEEREERK